MHDIEPFINWQHLYLAEEDELSPFYGQEHSEFTFSNKVYNYFIHPQWDAFGSETLYLKVLFADYEQQFVIMELIGEWNDAVENDVMALKRNVIDPMLESGINKFILITENVMNFHASDDSYYEEWQEDVSTDGGWILFLNTPEHEWQEFQENGINRYVYFLNYLKWRTHQPLHLFELFDKQISGRGSAGLLA